MRTLQNSLEQIFNGCGIIGESFLNDNTRCKPLVFMEIPNEDRFAEIPAVINWRDIIQDTYRNKTIILPLKSHCRVGNSYKTIDSTMKWCIACHPLTETTKGAMRIEATKGDISVDYYIARGLITDSNMVPVVTMSHIIKYDTPAIKCITNLVRIDPVCFQKNDTMQKWIVNKLLKTLVDMQSTERTPLSIVIEPNPFKLTTHDTPDVLTTREDLMQCVEEHLDDIF